MRDDTFTRTEADAADYAWLQGRDEDFGGDICDQEPSEPREFCSLCERGHTGVVCRWCVGLGRTS